MIDYPMLFGTYFVVWWLSLFLVLPFGQRTQADSGSVVQGTEPGAPLLPKLGRRLIVTTLLAMPLTALLLWGASNPVLQRYWS